MPKTRRLSDANLVRRSQQGDRRAFGALVGRYDWRLRGLAFALLLDQGEMDAALASAYLRAWRDVVRISTKDDIPAWLYRNAYNACVDRLRLGRPAARSASATDSVVAGLAGLPDADRVALVLVDREGFGVTAAARIMGVSPAQVESRVTSARAQLASHVPAPKPEPAAAPAPAAESEPDPDETPATSQPEPSASPEPTTSPEPESKSEAAPEPAVSPEPSAPPKPAVSPKPAAAKKRSASPRSKASPTSAVPRGSNGHGAPADATSGNGSATGAGNGAEPTTPDEPAADAGADDGADMTVDASDDGNEPTSEAEVAEAATEVDGDEADAGGNGDDAAEDGNGAGSGTPGNGNRGRGRRSRKRAAHAARQATADEQVATRDTS